VDLDGFVHLLAGGIKLANAAQPVACNKRHGTAAPSPTATSIEVADRIPAARLCSSPDASVLQLGLDVDADPGGWLTVSPG